MKNVLNLFTLRAHCQGGEHALDEGRAAAAGGEQDSALR